MKNGALSIDYEGRKIYLADKVLKVTAKEFDLLEYFVKHKGMILSRDKILSHCIILSIEVHTVTCNLSPPTGLVKLVKRLS